MDQTEAQLWKRIASIIQKTGGTLRLQSYDPGLFDEIVQFAMKEHLSFREIGERLSICTDQANYLLGRLRKRESSSKKRHQVGFKEIQIRSKEKSFLGSNDWIELHVPEGFFLRFRNIRFIKPILKALRG